MKYFSSFASAVVMIGAIGCVSKYPPNSNIPEGIVILVGGATIMVFHALRRSYLSTSIYSAFAAAFVCVVAFGAILRLHGITWSWSWDPWYGPLLTISYLIGGMTLWTLPAAFVLGIPFWMHRHRQVDRFKNK